MAFRNPRNVATVILVLSLAAPARTATAAEISTTTATIRTWADATGKFRAEADLLAVRDRTVYLLISGTPKAISLDRLSKPDQEFVAEVVKSQSLSALAGAHSASLLETDPFAADGPYRTQQPAKSPSGAKVATAKRIAMPAAPVESSSSYVDRNPNGETVTGHTATGIPTFTGSRGGQYHYSKSGNKVYERHKK